MLIISCIQDPINTSIINDDLIVQDTIFYDIDSFTYQTPPEVGNQSKLYFGVDSGYSCLYTLINIAPTSTDNSTSFLSLIDSTIVGIDSVLFFITAPDTQILDGTDIYYLNYFPPAQHDSIFSETETNYLNFDTTDYSDIINNPVVTASLTQEIDTIATHPFLKFDLSGFADTLISGFTDTSGLELNRSFAVWRSGGGSGISEFYSRDANSYKPRFKVHFRKIVSQDSLGIDSIETFEKSFFPDGDVSIIYPPELVPEDTTSISIGRAKGLKARLYVDIDAETLPESAVIRTAELILYQDSTTAAEDGFFVSIYSIDTTFNGVIEYPILDDPVKLQLNLDDQVINANRIVINLRNLLGAVALDQINNYGLKLFSKTTNDPFTVARFSRDTRISNVLRPSLRVIYVSP